MRKSWLIMTVLIIASLLLAACPAAVAPTGSTGSTAPAAGEAAAPTSGTGGTLIVGRGGDSVGLDSGTQTDGESARVINTIVDGLVIADPKVVEIFNDTHFRQMIGYLAITKLQLALLINFKHAKLDWRRVVREIHD